MKKTSKFAKFILILGAFFLSQVASAYSTVYLSNPVLSPDEKDRDAVSSPYRSIRKGRIQILSMDQREVGPGEFYRTLRIRLELMNADNDLLQTEVLEGSIVRGGRKPFVSFYQPDLDDRGNTYSVEVHPGGFSERDPHKVVVRFGFAKGPVFPPYAARVYLALEFDTPTELPVEFGRNW